MHQSKTTKKNLSLSGIFEKFFFCVCVCVARLVRYGRSVIVPSHHHLVPLLEMPTNFSFFFLFVCW